MKKYLFTAHRIQLLLIQLCFGVFFFFLWTASFAQIHVSSDVKFNVNSGTTIIDHATPTLTEQSVIHLTKGVILYDFDETKNVRISKVQESDKKVRKVKKNAPKKSAQSAVKKTELSSHFNAVAGSGEVKENHSSSVVVILSHHHQVKVASLAQYLFQSNLFFYLNLMIGVVLLIVFHLFFKSFRARPPPLF